MTAGEPVFLDTSFLIAVSMESHPNHRSAHAAFMELVRQQATLFISPQICREFIVALTRGPFGDLQVGLDEALHLLDEWLAECAVLDEHRGVLREWQRLIERYRVLGKQVHDANIVACMKLHGVRKLVTRNADDFKRYAAELEIQAIE